MNLVSPDSKVDPWDIPRPGPKPGPGPEREAWLDLRRLRRFHKDLHDLLDSIDPALRKNQATVLDHDLIAERIVEFILHTTEKNPRAAVVRILLRYLNRGFRHYCREHDLASPRIPLISDFGLEDGLLNGAIFDDYRLFLKLVDAWSDLYRDLERRWESATPKEFGHVLLAAAVLFGGLPHKRHWDAIRRAGDGEPSVQGEWIYITYQFDGHPFRWLLDPVTEALWRRIRATRNLTWASVMAGASLKGMFAVCSSVTSAIERGTKPESVLECAVTASLLHHYAPDVVNIAMGSSQNVALPDRAFRRLLGAEYPHSGESIRLSVVIRARRPSLAAGADGFSNLNLEKLWDAVKWSAPEKRAEGLADTKNRPDPRPGYIDHVRSKVEEIRKDVERHCAERGDDPHDHFVTAVCQFVNDLMASGGPIRDKLAPSTIAGYARAIIRWYPREAIRPISQLEAKIRERAYANVLSPTESVLLRELDSDPDDRKRIAPEERPVLASRSTREVSVQLFERTLLEHFGIEDEVDWTLLPRMKARKAKVNANLVDRATYERLLTGLASARCDDEDYRHALLVLSIILYRFGPRSQDAHEVTVADLELREAEHTAILHIPESRLTTRKSGQAIRRIGPVVLPPREFQLLADFHAKRSREAQGRRDLRQVYLFAQPGRASQLLSEKTLFDPITKLLREISGDTTLSPHHFRHGFGSRHFAAGRSVLADMDEAANRDPEWRATHADDGGWLRAFEIGHISPAGSTSVYVNSACFVHNFYARRLVDAVMPLELLSSLAGLSGRSLERTRDRRRKQPELSDMPDSSSLLLQVVRRKWPSPPEEIQSVAKRSTIPWVEFMLTPGEEWAAVRTDRESRVGDVFGVLGDTLVGTLDVSVWEAKGYSAGRVRQWSRNAQLLIVCGYFDGNRRRRPSLSPGLCDFAERLLNGLTPDDAADLPRLIARALVGMRHRGSDVRMPIEQGYAFARILKNVADEEVLIEAEPSKPHGVCVTLAKSKLCKRPGELRILVLCLAVLLLNESALLEWVKPYI